MTVYGYIHTAAINNSIAWVNLSRQILVFKLGHTIHGIEQILLLFMILRI